MFAVELALYAAGRVYIRKGRGSGVTRADLARAATQKHSATRQIVLSNSRGSTSYRSSLSFPRSANCVWTFD